MSQVQLVSGKLNYNAFLACKLPTFFSNMLQIILEFSWGVWKEKYGELLAQYLQLACHSTPFI
jgi:hypothetical protein